MLEDWRSTHEDEEELPSSDGEDSFGRLDPEENRDQEERSERSDGAGGGLVATAVPTGEKKPFSSRKPEKAPGRKRSLFAGRSGTVHHTERYGS